MERQNRFHDLDELREARRWAGACCEEFGRAGLAATVSLMLDELLTNAFLHAGTSATVCISFDGTLIRCDVTDFGGGHLTQRARTSDQVGGWGLQLLDSLALSWDVNYHRIGKTVRFSLGAESGSGPVNDPSNSERPSPA